MTNFKASDSLSRLAGLIIFGLLMFSCAGGPALVEIRSGGLKLSVEVADNPGLRQRGLMYRDHLPPGQGMIFVFENEQMLSFWMHNTRIPLDIAYLDRDGRVLDILSMKPFDETPVPSSAPAQYAVEVNTGGFSGVKKGQVFDLSSLLVHLNSRKKDQS